jgi:hypothetical protein
MIEPGGPATCEELGHVPEQLRPTVRWLLRRSVSKVKRSIESLPIPGVSLLVESALVEGGTWRLEASVFAPEVGDQPFGRGVHAVYVCAIMAGSSTAAGYAAERLR